MDSQPLDVVICPPRIIQQNAIDISHSLAHWDTNFTLTEEGPFPHISLYQAQFPMGNLPEIKLRLNNYAKLVKAFTVKPVPELYEKEDVNYIEVSYEKSIELSKLQFGVIELLNSLRDGLLRARDKERYYQVSPIQRENLDKWGYRSVGDAFRPHLSLTSLKNPDSVSTHGILRKKFAFAVNQIGLFQLGEHGTCINKIALYDLSG
jgi:hypothetical protein